MERQIPARVCPSCAALGIGLGQNVGQSPAQVIDVAGLLPICSLAQAPARPIVGEFHYLALCLHPGEPVLVIVCVLNNLGAGVPRYEVAPSVVLERFVAGAEQAALTIVHIVHLPLWRDHRCTIANGIVRIAHLPAIGIRDRYQAVQFVVSISGGVLLSIGIRHHFLEAVAHRIQCVMKTQEALAVRRTMRDVC